MQCLPRKSFDNALERFSEFVGLGLVGTAILQITYEWMTNMGHVHAYLMCSACFQDAFHKGSEGRGIFLCPKTFLHLKMRYGVAGIITLFMDHSLFGTVAMGAAERGIDGPGRPVGGAPDDRKVCALQIACTTMIGKLRAQVTMGKIILGYDHDAAGFLVEAMHNTGSLDTADARQCVTAMVNQCVDERAGPIAVARMHDEPCRLVDDNEVSIFIENIKRNFLALRGGIFGFGDLDSNIKTFTQFVLGLRDDPAFNTDLALIDQ
ncbi:hypothetical protein DEV91_114162 [Phyllobacterium brassicacearum]|nr:hypothetical protein DEV91_114162 [Phyllobacterium brassicacearum]